MTEHVLERRMALWLPVIQPVYRFEIDHIGFVVLQKIWKQRPVDEGAIKPALSMLKVCQHSETQINDVSHAINIPVYLSGWSVKASWGSAGERRGVPLVEMYEYDTNYDLITNSPDPEDDEKTQRETVAEFQSLSRKAEVRHDCWRLIQDFTALKTTEALLSFLNSSGMLIDWQPDYWQNLENARYPVTAFWALQEMLVRILTSGKTSMLSSPTRDMPDQWVNMFNRGFELRLKRSGHAYVAETGTGGTFLALIYTAQVKVLQGRRFRICKRTDCERVFEVETRGRRANQYCSHLCAHTAWQRRARKTKVQAFDERSRFGYGPNAGKPKGKM